MVAANAGAHSSGTTPEFLEYKRTNFVLLLHDDGTLGEYMHLSPSSVQVQPGERVERLQPIALSGNTGFSSTPHLHFQVMTASDDASAKQSFPFELAKAGWRSVYVPDAIVWNRGPGTRADFIGQRRRGGGDRAAAR